MSRTSNTRFVKPMLENLEDRIQPALLIGSNAVNVLVNQVNTVLTDMQHAQTNLKTDFTNAGTALTANPNGDNVRAWSHPFGKAVADYQQILQDQASIHLMVSTDQAFLQAAAFSEFTAGDPIDLIILTFFKGSAFDPTTKLIGVQNQADSIVKNTDVQNEINFVFKLRNPVVTPAVDQITILSEANTPGFGQ